MVGEEIAIFLLSFTGDYVVSLWRDFIILLVFYEGLRSCNRHFNSLLFMSLSLALASNLPIGKLF